MLHLGTLIKKIAGEFHYADIYLEGYGLVDPDQIKNIDYEFQKQINSNFDALELNDRLLE